MATKEKTVSVEAENTDKCGHVGLGAGISCALGAVRGAHAAVLESWHGKASEEAEKAFGRLDAEMDRYERMVERLVKSYSGTGDRDAG